MKGSGHHITGSITGVGLYFLFIHDSGNPLDFPHLFEAAVLLVGAQFGAKSPDWLEIPHFGKRLIPHRRITHWLLLWFFLVGLFYAKVFSTPETSNYFLVYLFLFGFSSSGLTHVLFDLPNPQGIPVLHPWKRSSLNLWRSGQREFFIISFFGAFWYCLYLVKNSIWLRG